MGYGETKEKAWFPYNVSSYWTVDKESPLRVFDSLLHLTLLVAVWVFEIITIVVLKRHEDAVFKDFHETSSHKTHPLEAVAIASIVTLAIATGANIFLIIVHWATRGIGIGMLPTMVMALITGGMKSTTFFSILVTLLSCLVFVMEGAVMITCNSFKECSHKSVATLLDEEEEFFGFLIVLVILKFYALSVILTNVQDAFSGRVEKSQSIPDY